MELVYTSNAIYSSWENEWSAAFAGFVCTWLLCPALHRNMVRVLPLMACPKKMTLISSLIFLGHPNLVTQCLRSIKPAELSAASCMDNKRINPDPPSKNKSFNNCILMVITVSLMHQVHFGRQRCSMQPVLCICFLSHLLVGLLLVVSCRLRQMAAVLVPSKG